MAGQNRPRRQIAAALASAGTPHTQHIFVKSFGNDHGHCGPVSPRRRGPRFNPSSEARLPRGSRHPVALIPGAWNTSDQAWAVGSAPGRGWSGTTWTWCSLRSPTSRWTWPRAPSHHLHGLVTQAPTWRSRGGGRLLAGGALEPPTTAAGETSCALKGCAGCCSAPPLTGTR